ncbi:MAG: hypothetical protein MK132_12050 [Lentisphaerales bacterium]|nr:hypothetical protein [Lentisphaerales bacterium]
MKDPAAFIFFLIIILGVIFEKIAKFKNTQKQHSYSKKAVSQGSAEEFFRRAKSEAHSQKPLQQEITYAPDETEVQPLAEATLNIHTDIPQASKKKSNKTFLNLKDKKTLKQAYILKTILERPQSYKF